MIQQSIFVAMATLFLVTNAEMCPDNCKCDYQRGVVDCRNAGLVRFPAEIAENVHIRELDLRNNEIRELITGVVSYPNLELLDISSNKLVSIDDRVFEALPKLRSLYLQNNDIAQLSESTFTGLKSLKVLDLSHNLITLIKDRVFSSLTTLEDLILQGNGLDQIRDDSFQGLQELRSLDISDNRLLNIPVTALKKTSKITKLYLNDNHIDTLPTHAFSLMKDLYELRLDGNQVSRISDKAFSDHIRLDTPYLTLLNLRSNRINKIPSQVLTRLTSLVSLDLSENPLSVVDPDSFKGLNKLRSVYLNSLPKLRAVRSFAFSELENLQSIEIHSNRQLEDIADDAFIGLSNLRNVDLHANRLASVSANLLEWDKMESLDLRYNPWHCDCHLRWLPGVLSAISTNSSRHLTDDVRCETPESLASQHVKQVSPKSMKCPKPGDEFEEEILIAITGGISVALLLIMFCLLYKHNYCNLQGKRNTGQAVYHAHNNCNGHIPQRHGCDEERVNIANNEYHQGGGDNAI